MVFLTYDFLAFLIVFAVLYCLFSNRSVRVGLIVVSSLFFLWLYGGTPSVLLILVLAATTFATGLSGNRMMMAGGIAICVAALVFYKYTAFILGGLGAVFPSDALNVGSFGLVPTLVPLGISFFTFEFVHYLVDVRRGHPAISSAREFLSFGLFWPTMVAGPIKRYEQFVPSLRQGVDRADLDDIAQGILRITLGLIKKWAADNLTGYIDLFHQNYLNHTLHMRWVFIVAISLRILLDFSGYSDLAIGFARVLGIRVPENFNWPYLASTPARFWQRWHMSLSSWIRDYIYIPLGGNRLGAGRRVANGLTAMVLCGLWHGPSWNFAVWGLYHGCGLAVTSSLEKRRTKILKPDLSGPRRTAAYVVHHGQAAASWAATMVFVGLGWLLFFYPLPEACRMALHLFRR